MDIPVRLIELLQKDDPSVEDALAIRAYWYTLFRGLSTQEMFRKCPELKEWALSNRAKIIFTEEFKSSLKSCPKA